MKTQILIDFIQNKMRMSHIYQPVMLLALIRNGGTATRREIASSLLSHDESQIEYYERIAMNMVGRVLRKNGIVEYDRESQSFSLVDHNGLSPNDLAEISTLCEAKLAEYIERRGKKIWDHRARASGVASGTVRYEVLKRARHRCELCGTPADVKALQVDHIVPRNKGGSDDISNLQALCYSCNAMKRDHDDTDFRNMEEEYSVRESGCIFCDPKPNSVVAENELAVAIRDQYPVTLGHSLIIPRRHLSSYFDLGRPEVNACNFLLEELREATMEEDPTVSGFNIGVNDGESAVQTIEHCHIHLIPRRDGDIDDPTGGIRGVIPDKRKY